MNATCRLVIANVFACVLLYGCSAPSPRDGLSGEETETPPWFDHSIDSLVARSLRRFHDAEEFEAYRARLRDVAGRHHASWASTVAIPSDRLLASLSTAVADGETPCDPALEDCARASSLEEITVSATLAKPSITNNQEPGVDEGDIVKQWGRFLIVLHDGRLFSIDVGAAPGTMTFVDRIDVYPAVDRGTWYDELLITDDRLIVTGYDYEQEASELALFRIDSNGVFSYDATYYITSDDYYSPSNYASRLVDGSLVLYTPLYLTQSDGDKPLEFPKVRRWTPDEGYSEWQDLFAPTDIYFPIQRTLWPTVHTISVCPLAGRAFRCRSTGVIGPAEREFYVSPEYAYVWVSTSPYDVGEWRANACEPGALTRGFRPLPAAVYRIPLAGGRADAVFTAGTPKDQFSLDARAHEFLALLRWAPGDCDAGRADDETYPLRYARIPTEAFSSRPAPLPPERYFPLPTPAGDDIENRFTDRYLVYGGSQGRWGAYYWRADYYATDLIAVPIDAPESFTAVPLAHSAERVEVFGDNVVVDGYRGVGGLSVSTVDLRARPVVSDVAYLEGVIESEGRSHAFNGVVDDRGGGMFGLPTVFKKQSWRDYFDAASNVHFFAVDPSLAIHPAGYLAPDPNGVAADYSCEVSCIDWYGNARPIFMDGRVFALTSTELIEASFVAGQVLDLQRVNMTGIAQHRR